MIISCLLYLPNYLADCVFPSKQVIMLLIFLLSAYLKASYYYEVSPSIFHVINREDFLQVALTLARSLFHNNDDTDLLGEGI